jgi:hypothetical protein
MPSKLNNIQEWFLAIFCVTIGLLVTYFAECSQLEKILVMCSSLTPLVIKISKNN